MPATPRPALLLSLGLAAGAWLGPGLGRTEAVALLAQAGLLVGLALGRGCGRLAATALLAAATGVGATAAVAERARHRSAGILELARAQGGAPVLLEGRAGSDLRALGERWELLLEVRQARQHGRSRAVSGRVRVLVGGATPPPEVLEGDRVRAWVVLRAADQDAVGDAADRDGVHLLGICKSARLLAHEPSPHALARARAWSRRVLEARLPPGPEQGIVRAMVLGDRVGIPAEAAERLRAAGTYHVLAISGAQTALIAVLLLQLLLRAGVGPGGRAVCVTLALLTYAAFVGGQVPVVRATIMAVVLVVGTALDLAADRINLLGVAGLLLLAVRPNAIHDLGFQLSFAATLGILALAGPLIRALPRLPLGLHVGLAASLAAQAPLLPLLAASFHRLTPAAPLLNLVAGPLASGAMVLGGLALALDAPAPWLATLAGEAAWAFAHALLRSADLPQALPALDWRVASPPAWATTAWLAGLLGWNGGARGRARLLALFGLAGLCLRPGAPGLDGRLALVVLDVGQGDALALRSPRGRVLLVDAGGRGDAGERVIGPSLWDAGVARVDALIATHAHADHVNGMPLLLRHFDVREAWEGLAPRRDPGYLALDAALRSWGGPRRALARGMRGAWEGVALRVLGPAPAPRPLRTRNEDSVVLEASYGEVRLLLAGDVRGVAAAALPADSAAVLKVPHHGSRDASPPELLARVGPRVAIISAGAGNPFGHPHPQALGRYHAIGARVYRTDRDGSVTVLTDGTRLWVRTQADPRETRFR